MPPTSPTSPMPATPSLPARRPAARRPRAGALIPALGAGLLTAAPALAHSGQGAAAGLAQGLVHPLLGADHLLAMVAVGLWSGLALPATAWAGAAAFLPAMAGGALVAFAGIALPGVEAGILLSVVLLGILVAVSRPGLPLRPATLALALAGIALAGALHGAAHGAEAAGGASAYVAGFLVSTALLHAGGIALARLAAVRPALHRGLGAAISGAGVVLAAV